MRSMYAGLAVGMCLVVLMPGAAGAAEGPPLSATPARLEAALHCPSAFRFPGREPVLLVHGLSLDAESAWSWNYLRALPAAGFDACAVDLPDRGLGDIQVSAEYVVYAVRRMHQLTGRKIDIVGHSKGPLEARWAIKWWPDVRAVVDDLVGLSSPNHGGPAANAACVIPCLPAVSQARVGSRFLAALNSGDETPGTIDQTSVISRSDGLIVPTSTSVLDGAANVVVQQRCPLRIVPHGQMLFDSVVYAIVLDALTNPGPAQLSRVSPLQCRRLLMPTVTFSDAVVRFVREGSRLVFGVVTGRKVTVEPELKPYVSGLKAR